MTEFTHDEWIVNAEQDRHGQVKLTLTETTAENNSTGSALRFPPELLPRVVTALRALSHLEVFPGDPEPPRHTKWDTGENYTDSPAPDPSLHWDEAREGWTWGTCAHALPWENYYVQALLPLTRTF